MIEAADNNYAPSQITDVLIFFTELTEAYLLFEEKIRHLSLESTNYPAATIFKECTKLSIERQQLAEKDRQMFDILDLAGSEIARLPIISDHQRALNRVNIAIERLYAVLKDVRASYEASGSPHINVYR